MGQCTRCGKKRFLLSFPKRYAIPELRAMVSHWPWHRVQVCPQCEPDFLEEFRNRVKLLAPQVAAEGGDVTAPVCLMCGTQDPKTEYFPAARWVDGSGAPVAGRFSVCGRCRGRLLVNGVISSAELQSVDAFERLLSAVPQVAEDLVRRDEGWSPLGREQPKDASAVQRMGAVGEAAAEAFSFWTARPDAMDDRAVRGAMLLPEGATAIPTHLRLQWKPRPEADAGGPMLDVYRMGKQYVLVRRDEGATSG